MIGVMIRTLHLAKPRGFCAGVVMAIRAVERAAAEQQAGGDGDLSVYHAIVHNDTVVSRLEREQGVHFVEDLGELSGVGDRIEHQGRQLSDTVVFSAHGVSPAVRRQAAALGLATIDATCPLVTKVHTEAKKYAKEGYHILLIGDSPNHQEVIGTLGEAPHATTVVSVVGVSGTDLGLADPETVTVPDPERVAVLTQTTLSVDDTMKTIDLLRNRFPKLVIPPRDDLCYATKNRQDSVRSIAAEVDLFLVLSSDYSSNGMRLVELAHSLMGNAKRVASVAEIREGWLTGIEAVGITSAASTPDYLVQEVVDFFRRRNPDLALVEEGEWENITFRQPVRVPAPAAD